MFYLDGFVCAHSHPITEKNYSLTIVYMKMRVLVYGLNSWPEPIGVGKYTGEMAAWLAANGCEVRVVTAYPYYPGWKRYASYRRWRYSRAIEDGVTIVRCPLYVPARPSGAKRMAHLFSFAAFSLPAVIWQAVTWRPDAVIAIAPTLFAAPGAALAGWVGGARTWLHIQDFEVDAAFELGLLEGGWLRRIALRMERWLLGRFDAVSSISDNMCRRLAEKGVAEDRIQFLPNWVDTNVIRPLDNTGVIRAEFGVPADALVALYAGNMNAKQGIETIIEAARLMPADANVHFVIAGDGPSRSRLEAMADGLGNVQFLALQPAEKLNRLLNLADIHLLPQLAGAADLVMPSKLTGMMASGRPAIALAAPGTQIAAQVAHFGLVVAPEDPAALTAAIQRLAGDDGERRRLGTEARRVAVQTLDRTSVLQGLKDRL